MKKKDGVFFIANNILIGFNAIAYMFYMMITLMDGVATAHKTLEEAEVAESISRLSHMGIAVAVAAAFVIAVLMLLNGYFYKNKKSAVLRVLCILLTMGLVVILVRNLSMFI